MFLWHQISKKLSIISEKQFPTGFRHHANVSYVLKNVFPSFEGKKKRRTKTDFCNHILVKSNFSERDRFKEEEEDGGMGRQRVGEGWETSRKQAGEGPGGLTEVALQYVELWMCWKRTLALTLAAPAVWVVRWCDLACGTRAHIRTKLWYYHFQAVKKAPAPVNGEQIARSPATAKGFWPSTGCGEDAFVCQAGTLRESDQMRLVWFISVKFELKYWVGGKLKSRFRAGPVCPRSTLARRLWSSHIWRLKFGLKKLQHESPGSHSE